MGLAGNTLQIQLPRCDDALLLPEPLVLHLLHRVPFHRAVLYHEPGEWPWLVFCGPAPAIAVLGIVGIK